MQKYYHIIRRVLLGLLIVGFLYAGVMKLLGNDTKMFLTWGFPVWSVYAIGGLQCFAALSLCYRPLVKMGMFFLTTIMIGAILTLAGKHLFFPDLLAPLAFLLGLFGLMYLKAKRPEEEEEGRWGLI